MNLGSGLQVCWLQKLIKIIIDLGIGFWKAEKPDYPVWPDAFEAQTPRLRILEGVLAGLQDWSPVPEESRNGGT